LIPKNNITYKVIFREKQSFNASEQSLTFVNIISKNYLYIPSNFISTVKILSEQNNNVIYFQNIAEVIIQGWEYDPPLFNYYLVILLITKKEEKKEGFLIGNIKKLKGDILIGVWPFIREFDYSKIALIHS
jgi:hypothetical protein